MNQSLPHWSLEYDNCTLCEHRCGVNRNAGEMGTCHTNHKARVFRHRVEYGEELELIPSHLFYLSGCDLRCKFCIAEINAFDSSRGELLTGAFLRSAIKWGREQKARNLQWVGGEPTIHLPAILEAMSECDSLPPIVWKSDFYGTPQALAYLKGVVETYVADFKFGNNTCATQIAKVDRYVETITRNLKIASQQGNLIVRHLLLPGHFDCCFRAIVDWVSEELPHTKFSIRDGYLPKWQAKHDPKLNQRISRKVFQSAIQFTKSRGLNLIT